MRKSFKYRIYPTKKQEVALDRTLSTCRHLYNDSLAERKRQAELNRLKQSFNVFPWGYPEWINYYDQANQLPLTKTTFQKEVYSQVLQNTLKRVDRSFQNFFKGAGYPRFQGRNRYNSFTYPGSGLKLNINEGKLILSKIGNIKIILQIQNMVKNHHIAKSILDASWSQLINLTIYKAEYAGKVVELVNPNGTSQTCICGYPVPKTLAVRVHSCPSCGLVLDRDHVSAMIIEKRSSTAGIAGIQARQSNPNREAMKREATPLVGW